MRMPPNGEDRLPAPWCRILLERDWHLRVIAIAELLNARIVLLYEEAALAR